MSRPTREALAKRIAADLFTDGTGRHAKRLVMEFDDRIPGTGWAEFAVRDRIATALLTEVLAPAGLREQIEGLPTYATSMYKGGLISRAAVLALPALATPDAAPTRSTAGDWTEDFGHENGRYHNTCCGCGKNFLGHKRRVVCKLCVKEKDAGDSPISAPPPVEYRHPSAEEVAADLREKGPVIADAIQRYDDAGHMSQTVMHEPIRSAPPVEEREALEAAATQLAERLRVVVAVSNKEFATTSPALLKAAADTLESLAALRAAVPEQRAPEAVLADEILAELKRARTKFPGENVTTLAMIEEVGELAKATFEESRDRVRKEAVQVATMAMRVVLDGDSTLDSWRERKGLDPLVPVYIGAPTTREGEVR